MKFSSRLLRLVYITAYFFYANNSFAQVRLGPQAGINFSELPNSDMYIIGKHHVYSGYHIGAVVELSLYKNLFLQPGILISHKGSSYIVGDNSGGNSGGFSDYRISSFNAEIPLDLIWKFELHSYKLLMIAGPHFGYGLKGRWETSAGTSSNVHFGNDPVDDLKSFDYGIDIGAGVEIGRIQLSSIYYLGLRTLSTMEPQAREQKYRVLNISVTYLFVKEKRYYCDYESQSLRKFNQHKRHNKKY